MFLLLMRAVGRDSVCVSKLQKTTVSCKVDTAHTDIIETGGAQQKDFLCTAYKRTAFVISSDDAFWSKRAQAACEVHCILLTSGMHDAQLNFYGNRLATCSSDRTVKIFEVKANGYIVPIAELAGHCAPVWQVSWAHPDFGGLLASAGYDRKVIIWAENNGRWQKSHEWSGHEASVNSVAFAPHQLGLLLATASADSSIGILEFNPQSAQWMETKISKAHEQGANAVSWCPAHRVTDSGDQPYRKRLASCGNDKLIKIWVVDEKGEWIVEKSLPGHSDYVRDVAWCPVVNHSTYTIASCGLTDDALWHVSWSVCGTILSVSGEDNKIALWRENLQGQWQKMDDSDGKH